MRDGRNSYTNNKRRRKRNRGQFCHAAGQGWGTGLWGSVCVCVCACVCVCVCASVILKILTGLTRGTALRGGASFGQNWSPQAMFKSIAVSATTSKMGPCGQG